tara:strand:- start:64 stop:1647 length:1584 start_codon:yes stop_codon:yes gene_type:complete
MKPITSFGTQTLYDNIRLSGRSNAIKVGEGTSSLNLTAGGVTIYDATNDGNPTISLGSGSNERLQITAEYESGAQGLDVVKFTTYTQSGSADDGRMSFFVDEDYKFGIVDAGVNIGASEGLSIGGIDILTDSSGTTTLNNIDALDATTEATIESAIDSLGNLTSAEGLATVGTITTGVWQGTVIASAYLDADTAHLSGAQTFTGVKTFPSAIFDGDISVTPRDGSRIHIDTATITDSNTSASGTAAANTVVSIETQILAATNASVTNTNAASLYIAGAPSAGTNMTLTNAWAIWVAAGNVRFDGSIYSGTTEAINSSGLVTVANQSNITGVGTISSGTWQGTAIAHAYIGNDAIDGDNIADDAVDSEHYTDGSIDTAHIGDDQVTFAKASGVTPKVYGSTIKLLPSDFQANIDGGNTKFGVGYTDTAGSAYGMKVANSATELYAFVSIPEGMKATHVDIYDKDDLAIEVFEVQINATTMTSKGSGNCNTTLDITDVNATATNFLAILVTTTATTNKIFGGKVTIAAQ